MRSLLLALGLLLALSAPAVAATAPCSAGGPTCHVQIGKVTFVADGDTIAVRIDGVGKRRVRLTGIQAMERVARYHAEAERTGRIAAVARTVPEGGWFATPAVAAELPGDSPVLLEEIFGPLLAVERVSGVEEACDRVDASPYGLTGGLFARNPDTVDYVVERSPVGNLYVNRAITGAMVARQPFGGNRLSGTGTKAGGPDYLLHFVEPRVVTENTVRHGLVI